jgi:hypothetical protein
MRYLNRRTCAALLLAAFILQWPSKPATADCSGAYLLEVNRLLELEREKTDRFRTGNKADFKKLLDARENSGRYDKAANEAFGQDLMNRIREMHQGMQKQNAAVQALRQALPAAVERNDCPAAQQAAEAWLQMARARIDEYDRYFSYIDSLAAPTGSAQPK